MKQEVGRLTLLMREKADLERQVAESQAALATRYFADPIHRIRSEHPAARANLAFANARKWLFFMGRALEYKS